MGTREAPGGFRVKEVRIDSPEHGKVKLYLYIKKVLGIGKLAYAPMWPNLFTRPVAPLLKERLGEIASSCFAIRFEPSVSQASIDREFLKSEGFIFPGGHVQYLSTFCIDLNQSAQDVLNSFSQTARQDIRTASKKHNVVCSSVPITDDSLAMFSEIISMTKARKNFYMRKDNYLNDYWQLFNLTGDARLYIAKKNYDVLCMMFVIVNGDRAFYKDGGSVLNDISRKSGASTLLQWYVMQDLMDQGVKSYDLCGALATGIATPDDPLWGVYNFKRKFSDDLIVYPGFVDLPLHTGRYKMWLRSEHYITELNRKITGDIWY